MSTPLVLDKDALRNLGLNSEIIYLFEYDIPSAFKNPQTKEISSSYTKEQAMFFRAIRNKLMFALKFKLHAVKNLYSSWFITDDYLERSEKFAESLRTELIAKGFSEKAEKVRIIPIVTTEEGFETFEARKEEFLLEFILESQKIIDKGLKEKRLSDSLVWRANKTVEIVSILKESLADKSKKSRYNEIVDSLTSLNDSVNRFEQLKQKAKEKQAKGLSKIKKAKSQKKIKPSKKNIRNLSKALSKSLSKTV